jgi:putative transposase
VDLSTGVDRRDLTTGGIRRDLSTGGYEGFIHRTSISSIIHNKKRTGGAMPFWQLFYHIVWSTKQRNPLITPEAEEIIYGLIRKKAIGLGATVIALNGVSNHVHLVTAIPPKIAVATFIGQIKGVSSATYNRLANQKTSLYWQDEYGVFSFDKKRLPNYIAYVERQKEHHSQGKTIPILEREDEGSVKQIRDIYGSYIYEPDEFWNDFIP